MNKIGLALLAIAGLFVGGIGLLIVVPLRSEVASLKSEHKKDQEAMSRLLSRMEGIDQKLGQPVTRPTDPDSDSESPGMAGPAKGERETKSPSVKPPSGPKTDAPGESTEDFAELQKKVLTGAATEEEKERFWKLAQEKPALLDDIIKQLEKAAADDPRNIEAHRRLADAYFAKLMAVPDGVMKGMWSSKMIGEEKKILEIDPGDWEARFSVATNYSFWPEQYNKRPDAIKEFETLKKIQETRPADPKFAQVYFQLRQLYLKEGRVDDAKTILEEGLRLYPNDANLIKARDGAK